jgi:hypothetical protein
MLTVITAVNSSSVSYEEELRFDELVNYRVAPDVSIDNLCSPHAKLMYWHRFKWFAITSTVYSNAARKAEGAISDMLTCLLLKLLRRKEYTG